MAHALSPLRGDPMPHVRPAGKVVGVGGEVKHVFSAPEPPATPDALKPFRKNGTQEIGVGASHYAKAGGSVQQISPEKTFGSRNRRDDSTAQRFSAMKVPNFAPSHRPYQSDLMEPLGKSAVSSTVLPPKAKDPAHSFGKKTLASEALKGLMYPTDNPTTALGSPKKEPAFQVQRSYVGTYDPNLRFGATNKPDAPLTLSPTKMVQLQDTAKRTMEKPPVGSPRITGVAPRADPQHTFGKPLKRVDGTMRDTLMQSHNTARADGQPEPGDDLGQPYYSSPRLRSVRGKSTQRATQDAGRAFGVPSVRTDLPSPKYDKITNATNFGTELGAGECLFPSVSGAVQSTASFDVPLADIAAAHALCDRLKFDATDAEIAAAYRRAQAKGPVTMVGFKRALDAVDEARF